MANIDRALLDSLAEVTDLLDKHQRADWLRTHATFDGYEPSPAVHRARRRFLAAYAEGHQG